MRVEGRAWSGWAPIERVEVSVDGGETWAEAELGEARRRSRGGAGDSRGTRSRASTSSAAVRPTRPGTRSRPSRDWNVGGYCNNAVQRVRVTVS